MTMRKKRIHALVIFGTRPEAIKLAPVIRELRRKQGDFKLTVCATAQHRQMLDQVTRLFRIQVHYDLDLMRPNQGLDELTARAMVKISSMLKLAKPDVVIVQGDTTTAFVGALSAFYLKIPTAHVEAGLRTEDKFAPFPEEINRRLTSHLAAWHFAPTEWARSNLLKEGVPSKTIFVTGNTIVDVLLAAKRLVAQRPPAIPSLNGLRHTNRKLILVTAHRRENFGEGIKSICTALRDLAASREDVEIVYPVHPNPNVLGPVNRLLAGRPRIHLIKPLEYLQFVSLMTKAYLVLTDSGGIQEEMPSFGRPVLVMRDKTERPEGVEAGVCKLVGTDSLVILDAANRLLSDQEAYRQFVRRRNPFGDGKASQRIVKQLADMLS